MDSSVFKPCIVIPVYNHQRAVAELLPRLLAYQLPVLLIDDGSAAHCQQVLQKLADEHALLTLISLPINRGKGAAVKVGLQQAQAEGFSHAIQMDADGQHEPADISRFIALANTHRQAIICGHPIYDDSVPRVRFWARYLTHVWIWINSLSFEIKDSMCGFRIYPLPAVTRLLAEESMGDRMDFDPELMVRWLWRGGEVINVATQVRYPEGGISHFAPFRDNYLISVMHTRLFFGMLWRLPTLLGRKLTSRGN